MTKKLVFFFLILAYPVHAQQASVWYFGDKAGVDFRQGKPIVLIDGTLTTWQTSTSVCNKSGDLLFYTDGLVFYNKQHTLMPNGKSLVPNPYQAHAVLSVPFPTQKSKYFVFSVLAENVKKGFGITLFYSVIDMTLENGLGDIVETSKNIVLRKNVAEKITAVRHQNGKDTWLLAHELQSNKFLAYLITENGISEMPIESEVGSIHLKIDYSKGSEHYMSAGTQFKSNTDGTNIALTLRGNLRAAEVFDFDNASGKVSNPVTLPLPLTSNPAGIEFSPTGSFLYVAVATDMGKIFQYNLQVSSSDKIASTQKWVGTTRGMFGALQLAPDGKIYLARGNKKALGAIQKPDVLGLDCQYEDNAILLKGFSTFGLPTFVQSFFEPQLANSITYFDKNKLKKGDKVVLKNVQFAYGLATLQLDSFTELDALAEYMQKYPQASIKLSGHTDNMGNKPANIVLSQNRANAVKAYLVGKKIADSRISFEGFGSSLPIATNDSEEGRTKNRRVEVEILE
jgi:outer membrane protein OmpA-like peptidoglycan-associated protein